MAILGRLVATRIGFLARPNVRSFASCSRGGISQSEASTPCSAANHVSSFKPALLSLQSHVPRVPCRYMAKKSGKSKGGASNYDDEEEEFDLSLESGEAWKDVLIKTNSLRVDVVAAMVFKSSRSGSESDIYGSKLRLNAAKIKKKSEWVSVGDKLDLVDGEWVTRAEVVKIDTLKMAAGGKFPVVVRKFGKVQGHEDYKHEY